MWLDRNPTNIKRSTVRVSHSCGHDFTYPMHPDVDDRERKKWVKEKSKEPCAECVALAMRKQTRERNRR